MDILAQALDFERAKYKTRSEKITASREAKRLILALNEVYKLRKDPSIMDIMKRLTALKKKFEKRL